ncbi:MAG: hypothetical protein BWY63_02146 [Chloroflexi bacterium ADurb.Bin360]|nr:MAG: hypothetical protein BWY63_02146 [Chloroflexi bacterium ADurb.Bin360]
MPGGNDTLAQIGVSEQRQLNHLRLNPVATHLDHEIHTPQVVEHAIRIHPPPIAGKEDAPVAAIRVGQKTGGSFIGQVPITGAEETTTHANLTRFTTRDRLSGIIPNENFSVNWRITGGCPVAFPCVTHMHAEVCDEASFCGRQTKHQKTTGRQQSR